MKPTGFSRGTIELSECLRRRLDSYAFAASAAGVGLLALTRPAEARIVYSPAHERITVGKDVSLDLNHDGINDFKFHVLRSTFPNGTFLDLNVYPEKEDKIWGVANNGTNRMASALPMGRSIGGPKNSYFYKNANFMAGLSATSVGARKYSGFWANGGEGVKNRYLGLKFFAKGHAHFGWARLSVKISYSGKAVLDAVLTGYAYETIPNKPIITGRRSSPENALDTYSSPLPVFTAEGQPATLRMLALGSPALSIWRKRQPATR